MSKILAFSKMECYNEYMGEKLSENIYRQGISQEKLPENRTDHERFEDAKKFGNMKIISLIQGIRASFNWKLPIDFLSNPEIFDRKKIEKEAYEYMLLEWMRDGLIVPDDINNKLKDIVVEFVQKQIDLIKNEIETSKGYSLSERIAALY